MIKSQVVAHSIDPRGNELVSILATFPRIILAEVNTHRMLSKNTSSSRAIPFNKMIEAVKENPFIPIAFQKEHKGMQGNKYLYLPTDHDLAYNRWIKAKNSAIENAQHLHDVHVTKQLANRLLEPFMWTTMLITGPRYGGGWDNFFNLRCPQYYFISDVDNKTQYFKSKKDWLNAAKEEDRIEEHNRRLQNNNMLWFELNKGQAEIHMMALAESIYDSINESIPKELQPGEWHIPFGDRLNDIGAQVYLGPNATLADVQLQQVKISTAMAARTSYTVVGDEKEVDYNKMIELHDRLIAQNPPHSSPMEHCALCMTDDNYNKSIKGEILGYNPFGYAGIQEEVKGWCRNFKGFIPYRHIIENG